MAASLPKHPNTQFEQRKHIPLSLSNCFFSFPLCVSFLSLFLSSHCRPLSRAAPVSGVFHLTSARPRILEAPLLQGHGPDQRAVGTPERYFALPGCIPSER